MMMMSGWIQMELKIASKKNVVLFYMDIPYPGEQTCEYCKTNFIIGNCGLEYEGRGYCYECAAFKRKAKATVWFKGRYYPKAYKDVVEEWPIWEKRSEDDRRRKEQEGRSRTRGG